MKIYLVGGAIRNELLNLPIHDRDYVVVGSTPEEMLSLGYKQVGNDFPVFLHPETGEEYALARKEISTGSGYQDFKFDFSPNVTLEEDLYRRDLTVNAIAEDVKTNELIDPFGGIKDIENKVLRHVSEHFIEDPLRILRLIRFQAQLPDFTISGDTISLCRRMNKLNMLKSLSPERIWKEIDKALHTDNFDLFIHYLELTNSIQVVLPDILNLEQCIENPKYHPEGNTYNHIKLCLKWVKKLNLSDDEKALVNFGIICHDLGKLMTPIDKRPSYPGHEKESKIILQKMCAILTIPNEYYDFALLCAETHMYFYKFNDMKIKNQYDLVKYITKFVSDRKLKLLYAVHKCDLLGKDRKITHEEVDYSQKAYKRMCEIFNIMKGVKLTTLPLEVQVKLSRFKGEQFGKLYRDAMISYLKHNLKNNRNEE